MSRVAWLKTASLTVASPTSAARAVLRAVLLVLAATLPQAVLAQAKPADFPARPTRLIVPFPPAGATDVLARLISAFSERRWKQPMVVENRPGANTQIGVDVLTKSPPDGHTLLLCSINMAYEHLLNPAWPWHPIRDFSQLGLMAGSGFAIITNPAVPAKNLAEFVAYVKANPGKLNQGNNSSVSFQTEDLFNRLGISLERIPYKGGPAAIQAVMANEVQFYTSAPQDVLQLASQGRVRILAYTEKQRHPLLSEVPTTFESAPAAGDYEARFWFALIGPGGMSAPLVNFINAEMLEFVRTPEVRERLASLGLKTYNSTPDDVRKEFTTMAGQVETVMARGIKLR